MQMSDTYDSVPPKIIGEIVGQFVPVNDNRDDTTPPSGNGPLTPAMDRWEPFPLQSTLYEPCGSGCQQILTSDPMTNQLWVEQQKVAALVAAIERIEAATVERNSAIEAAIALSKRYSEPIQGK